MDSRELKKRILYEMAIEYEEEYNKRKVDHEFDNDPEIKNDYFWMLSRVYDLESLDITKAKIRRFEKILQQIVDNFESKLD